MEAIMMLYGLAIVAGAVACGIFAVLLFIKGALRTLYYKVSGKENPTRIYTVKYRVVGEYIVRVRAESREQAVEKAERHFEDERFDCLESPTHEVAAVNIDGELALENQSHSA